MKPSLETLKQSTPDLSRSIHFGSDEHEFGEVENFSGDRAQFDKECHESYLQLPLVSVFYEDEEFYVTTLCYYKLSDGSFLFAGVYEETEEEADAAFSEFFSS